MAISGNPASAKERDQAKRALAALRALQKLYEGTEAEDEVDQPVADEASGDGETPPEEEPEPEMEEE